MKKILIIIVSLSLSLFANAYKTKSSIEEEKRDGYIFSAQGNEPEWSLLMGRGVKSQFIYDGKKYMSFKLPKPRQSGDSTLYHYVDDSTTMMIELHHRRCHDTVSGKVFDTIVSIKRNGRLFTGCGNLIE